VSMAARATARVGGKRRGNPDLESWQVTRKEFLAPYSRKTSGGFFPSYTRLGKSAAKGVNSLRALQAAASLDYHRRVVGEALREGKPVPAHVLADYPDLQAGTGEGRVGNPDAMLPVSQVRVGDEIRVNSPRMAAHGVVSKVSRVNFTIHSDSWGHPVDYQLRKRDLIDGQVGRDGVVYQVVGDGERNSRKRNYPRSKYWHAVADDRGMQSVAYTGTMGAAQRAGKRLEAKGYRALVMPANEDDPRGWRKEWRMELKNPTRTGQSRYTHGGYTIEKSHGRFEIKGMSWGDQPGEVHRFVTLHRACEFIDRMNREKSMSQNPSDSSGIKFVLGIRGTGANRKSEVQSVLVPRGQYTEAQAASWVKEHGFRATGTNVESYGEYYRFRQERPGKYRTFATIDAGTRDNPSWFELAGRQDVNDMYREFHQKYLDANPETATYSFKSRLRDADSYARARLKVWLKKQGIKVEENPAGDIQDRFSSQLAERLWPAVTDVESEEELHQKIHQAMHGVSEPGKVGNPVDWEKSIKDFGAQFSKAGGRRGTTIQSARTRLQKWADEIGQRDDRHEADAFYYRAAIAWHEHLKGQRGYPHDEIDEALSFLGSKHGALWNPHTADSSAASLFEKFHGTPSTSVATVIEKEEYPDNLATLGQLVELKVNTLSKLEATIGFNGDAPTLASSPDGRQLYIVGGDQSLDLGALKISGKKWERDSMVLGVLDEFTYRTEKGFDNFKLSDYYHQAGEESGVQPMLVYDTINRRMSIVGGQYRVTPAGVVN